MSDCPEAKDCEMDGVQVFTSAAAICRSCGAKEHFETERQAQTWAMQHTSRTSCDV